MDTYPIGKFPEPSFREYILQDEELCRNSEPRAPIVVCIDCSFSMRQQRRLERVLEGLETFCAEMSRDRIACESVELCIVSYGGSMARVEQDFTAPDQVQLPHLTANGETPLADGVRTSLEILRRRLVRYQYNGNSHYRPWLILIGDGDETMSSRELDEAAALLKEESDHKRLSVLCVTVGDEQQIQCASLMKLAPDGRVQYLKDLKFREFFSWLSRSIQKTSRSMSGEEIHYEPTTTWAQIIERNGR